MITSAETVALRHAGADDADAIAYLHTEGWRRTYRGMMSDDFLENVRSTTVASPGARGFMPRRRINTFAWPWRRRLVGFICGFADHDPVWGSYIDNLHVIAGMQRRGIGRTLMRDVAGWLCQVRPDRGVWLWVMEANTSARAFYERLGATDAGTADLCDPDGGRAPNCRYVWPRPSVLLTQ
jgi:ribosomal protein S18 acetylase RimI-like enzyme